MNWALAHWRAVFVICAVAVAFLCGRFFEPAPEVHETERVVYRDRVVTVTQIQTEKQQSKVVYKDRVVTPDGTVKEHIEERTATTENLQVSKHQDAQVAIDAKQEVAIKPQAQWFVGALILFSPGSLTLKTPLSSLAGGLMVGRHLLGPLGATLSATVPFSQPIQIPTFTLALTLSF